MTIKKPREKIAFKSIFGIVFILAVFSLIVCIIGYRSFTRTLLEQYADGAFLTAETALSYVDGDNMDNYLNGKGRSDAYLKAWGDLTKLCNSSNSTFIYVILPDTTDYNHITFLFSTIHDGSPYTRYSYMYVRETTNDDYRRKYKAIIEEGSQRELVIRDQGYIETDAHITAMVPLKNYRNRVVGILCVQRQMDVLTEARSSYVREVILVLLVLAVLVIAVVGWYLSRVLLNPIKKISGEAYRFAKENTVGEEKLTSTIKNKDEIGYLAQSFDLMEEQIHQYVEDLTQVTAENERISTELALATRIQADVLPNTFPAFPDRHEFDIYASMEPAREVGGDFYDFFLVDEDHLCLIIADVSGKGIPAALFMMESRIILENNVKNGQSPAEVFRNVNEAICMNNREEMFVTVWLGILELSTGRLQAANAGHEYPVLMDEDRKFDLFRDKHGFVLGGMPGMKYKEYEIIIEPGSMLFIYTDGVPEATNTEGQMFGNARMLDVLNRNRDASPEKLLKTIRREVDEFVGEAVQFDDLTMLCVEYKGK